MRERINWIDWGKCMAICTVVFCHLPQSQEWFYYRFLQATIITVFFWASGYLKKDRESTKDRWHKYWISLILPYLLYNALVYPFWLVRFYLQNGGMPDLFHAMRPILGALLFQHENSFTEPLNGSLWYLPAILFMHLLIDWCRKGRHLHAIMITLCFLSVILYAANKRYEFLPNLTPIGIFSRLPYYYIGYVMGQRKMFRQCHLKRDLLMCLGCFSLSFLVFFWHLHEGNFLLHIVLFYPVNLLFLFGTLYGCLLLDRYKANIVINLSIGTLVIIGLHYPLVSLTNLILKHLLGLSGNICYHWYTALPVTIIILAVLYPIIVIAKRHFPILLGKKDAKGLF